MPAVAAFILMQMYSVDHRGVQKGIPAARACDKADAECLPKLTFMDVTGEAYTPESLAGKVVVVNFWATWCGPCRSEIPDLTRVSHAHTTDLVLLGIQTDWAGKPHLDAFAADSGLDYPVVPADQEILSAFGYPNALPTTFIYDRAGNLRFSHRGPLSSAALEDALAPLLAEVTPQ